MLANPLTVYRGDYRYIRKRQDVACLISDSVGDLVCIRGDKVNGKWRVERANPEDETKMPAIGILSKKTTPTVGEIILIGQTDVGFYTGLIPGRGYFVGSDGRPSLSIPSAGISGYAMVQLIGYAMAGDILRFVDILNMIKRR